MPNKRLIEVPTDQAMKYVLPIIFFANCVIPANCQSLRAKYFSEINSGFPCGASIILDNTGYFFKEHGCEETAYISFGRYKILRNGVVDFKYLTFDSMPPLREVRRSNITEKNDSVITIKLFDRYDQTLAYNFNIQLVDTSSQFSNGMTNDNGELEINRYKFKGIILTTLASIYGQATPIEVGSHSLDIFLNLPELFLFPTDVNIDQMEKLNLTLRKDGLYKIDKNKIVYKLTR
ncbi:MAG: hypothetical protein E6H09_09280 [Bacteroidetes bacterium]|nr:MAG: hypothetical protein E6H09_09280 [Bacteroidota bacterium]